MKPNTTLILPGSTFALLASICSAHGSVITTEINPSWTRPASSAQAAATLTTYAEWDGFAVTAATNNPTGASYFGVSLSAPVAGDSSSTTSGAFIIGNGTANNANYTNTSTGDIYSFSGVITPLITVPEYNIAGNQLKVLVQVEQDGSDIDTSQLTVNGMKASTLPNYSETQTYTDGGSDFGGFGTAYRNDYAWLFTLPADTSLLNLNFGWGETSASLVSAVIDTQSVPATSVPEPASIGLLGGSVLMLLGKRRRHA